MPIMSWTGPDYVSFGGAGGAGTFSSHGGSGGCSGSMPHFRPFEWHPIPIDVPIVGHSRCLYCARRNGHQYGNCDGCGAPL